MRKSFINDTLMLVQVSASILLNTLSGFKPGMALLAISLAVLVLYCVVNGLRTSTVCGQYFLFSLVALFSMFYALNEEFYYDVMPKVLACLVSMFFFFNYFRTREDIIKCIKIFCLGLFFVALYNIVYQTGVSRTLAFGGANPIGILMFIGLGFVILLSINKVSLLILLYVPAYLYVLIVTASQKSIISIILAVLLFFLLNPIFAKRKKGGWGMKGVLVIAGVVAIIYSSSSTDNESLAFGMKRTEATILSIIYQEKVEGAAGGIDGEGLRKTLRQKGWGYFFDRPLLGYGLNNFRELFGRETNLYTYSHSTPVELLVGMGMLGFVTYYLFFFTVLSSVVKSAVKSRSPQAIYIFCLLISVFSVSLHQQLYFDANIHMLFMIAICWASTVGKQTQRNLAISDPWSKSINVPQHSPTL